MQDVAAAALFLACKIEDTLKKSREILAAGHSFKHGGTNAEPINPDNSVSALDITPHYRKWNTRDANLILHFQVLDDPARRTLFLERMILETSSFDFRNRHSQPFLVKFCTRLKLQKEVARLAWDISVDCHRTLAPLKNVPHVQALAAICLAQKLWGRGQIIELDYEEFDAQKGDVLGMHIFSSRWNFTDAWYVDVVNDLLDLYTHHRVYTTVGERYSPEKFINIRIAFNKAAASDPKIDTKLNGILNLKTNGKPNEKGVGLLAPGITGLSEKDKMAIGESVRFMLDGERERRERKGRSGEE